MAQLTLNVPEALLEKVRNIDWENTMFKNKSDWLREIIRNNLPDEKTETKK